MRGTLAFDPAEYTYGEASVGVRRLLKDWAAIDWFVPPTNAPARDRATRSFEEHHRAAHAARPEVFPEDVTIRSKIGGWTDFHALYEQVSAEVHYQAGRQGPSWDWKFNGLKDMTRAHSEARGFSLSDVARPISAEEPPRPGELFFAWNDTVIWSAAYPRIDPREYLPPREANVASWYLGYANMDVTEAIEWQLAERSNDLSTNPFVPLMRVYAEGFYPFSLAPNEVVLFGFGTK